MTTEMLATVVSVLVLLVLLPALALVVWNQRAQERIHAEHTAYLYRQAERREQRIRELEDALYAKHAAILELPNINREQPPPPEPPLPHDVQRFIDGFEDADVRAEYAAEARALIADPNRPGAGILARLVRA